MRKKMITSLTRRQFVSAGATAIGGFASGAQIVSQAMAKWKHSAKGQSLIKGVQIGVITYSFRSMPDQSAEATLQYILDSGVSAIELMGDPAESFAGRPTSPVDRSAFFQLSRKERNGEALTVNEKKEKQEMQAALDTYNLQVAKWRASVSLDKFTEFKRMYQAAGVKIYAFKPSAFGKTNTDAEINYGMRAARELGASHITLEHPGDDEQTKRLGHLAKKNKVKVGYHGHEQQTPTFWDVALKQSSSNAMNIDIGHYIAAGNSDPLGIIKAKHDRIVSMHLKDRETPANGKRNLPWGTGDTPIDEILHLMHQQQYSFPATIELEYEVPADSDAVKEVAKCVSYCRKILEA